MKTYYNPTANEENNPGFIPMAPPPPVIPIIEGLVLKPDKYQLYSSFSQ
jgi:hypothetical protein